MIVVYLKLYYLKIATFHSVQSRNSVVKKCQLLRMRKRQDDISGL